MMSSGAGEKTHYTHTHTVHSYNTNQAVTASECTSVVSTKQGATYSWTIPQKKATRLTGGIGEKSKCSWRSARLAYLWLQIWFISFSLISLPLLSPTVWFALLFPTRAILSHLSTTDHQVSFLSFSPSILAVSSDFLFPSMSPALSPWQFDESRQRHGGEFRYIRKCCFHVLASLPAKVTSKSAEL